MIYLDAATTVPTNSAVQNRIAKTLSQTWGNVSGAHQVSRAAKNVLEAARENCAGLLGVEPDNIVFTSGATEALNIVLQGYSRAHPNARIFYSAIEHPAVTKTVQYFSTIGHESLVLSVDDSGRVNQSELDQVQPGDLVCVMPVNNEIGVVNDVRSIAQTVHERGGVMLLDCVQAFYVCEPRELCEFADYAVFSAHKLGGPQGVGLLMIKDRKSIDPLSFGGSQEWEMRPGTTPAFLIDAFSFVLSDALNKRDEVVAHIEQCRAACVQAIKEKMPDATIHASSAHLSPHIVAVDVGDIEAQMVVAMVDAKGVCVSRGSACASGATTPSPVLLALGIDESRATSTLRLSFHAGTQIDEITQAIDIIATCVAQIQSTKSRV